jgi:hypothetical protein
VAAGGSEPRAERMGGGSSMSVRHGKMYP